MFAQSFLQAQIKETSNIRVTGLCEGSPPVSGGFPSQRASTNAEDVSIWWRHHGNDWYEPYNSTDTEVHYTLRRLISTVIRRCVFGIFKSAVLNFIFYFTIRIDIIVFVIVIIMMIVSSQ